MINRKNLYGYRIENGELTIVPQEAATVERDRHSVYRWSVLPNHRGQSQQIRHLVQPGGPAVEQA